MKAGIQEIYCDEAGYTSNNLLDKEQPYFAYSSVAINNDEAKEFVKKIIKDYGIQGQELKGRKLLKYNRGRKAIAHIVSKYKDQIKISIFHKKLSLAGKFFEYIFEPCVAENNSLFYRINFHRFISHILFLHFETNSQYAEEIFKEFQELMIKGNYEDLNYLFGKVQLPNICEILEAIKIFVYYNKQSILEEIKNSDKWILELTTTAIFRLHADWGQEYQQIKVFCDKSQPLESSKSVFNAMINRKDKIFQDFGNGSQPMTFNLSEEIQLVDSLEFPGVQIADVAASACICAFKEGLNSKTEGFIEYLPSCLGGDSIIPDFKDHLDLNKLETKRNYLVLEELVKRSINQQCLLYRMEDFLREATIYLSMKP